MEIPAWRSNRPRPGTGEAEPFESLPDKPGEYQLACAMGMFRSRLIVE